MLDLTYVTPSNFGRYALQNDFDTNERVQTQQKTSSNNIPSLMSLSITPPIMTTNTQEKSTTPTSVIKENIEPVSFPHHLPGPIQRPTKLNYQSNVQSSEFFSEMTQSPSTPDVLVQINHLLDHQNSITSIPNASNSASSSTLIQDLSTPNIPWTPLASTEWSTKYESTWPVSTMQTPTIPSTTRMLNPFVFRQISKEETSVWPTALGTATPRSTPLATRTQQGNEWEELFQPTTPSTTDSTKPSNNNTWPKMLPGNEPSSMDNSTENKQPNEENNSSWNPMTPTTLSTILWAKMPSDENTDKKDQSRWDFAR